MRKFLRASRNNGYLDKRIVIRRVLEMRVRIAILLAALLVAPAAEAQLNVFCNAQADPITHALYCVPGPGLGISPFDPPHLGDGTVVAAPLFLNSAFDGLGRRNGQASAPPASTSQPDISRAQPLWPVNLASPKRTSAGTPAVLDFLNRNIEAGENQAATAGQRVQLAPTNPSLSVRLTQGYGPRSPPSVDRAGVAANDTNPGDPVDPASGEFVHSKVDFQVTSFGPDMLFQRVYRSRWGYHGPLGYGWTHSFDQHVMLSSLPCGAAGASSLKQAEWWDGRGNIVRFIQDGNGIWENRSGTREKFSRSGGDFVVRMADGTANRFSASTATTDQNGIRYALASITDLNSNQVTIQNALKPSVGTQGSQVFRPTLITNASGHQFFLRYDNPGYLDRVDDGGTILADYTVSGSALLDAKDTTGITERYEYDIDPARASVSATRTSADLRAACEDACGSCGGACAGTQPPAEALCASNCSNTGACIQGTAQAPGCSALCSSACTGVPSDGRGFCESMCSAGTPTLASCELWRPRTAAECGGLPFCPSAYATQTKYSDLDTCCPGPDFAANYQDCRVVVSSGNFSSTVNAAKLARLGMTAADFQIAPCIPNLPSTCRAAPAPPLCSQCPDPNSCQSTCEPLRACAHYSESHTWTIFGTNCFDSWQAALACFVSQYFSFISSTRRYFDGQACGSFWDARGRYNFDSCGTQASGVGGWECDACEANCGTCRSECASSAVERCERDGVVACQTNCASACTDALTSGCRSDCGDACAAGCKDVSTCTANCRLADFFGACENSCVDSCVAAGTSGAPRYGNHADLNFNLLRVKDNAGTLVLENIYETDLAKPSFDRVTTQVYGGETYSFAYYQIDAGTIVPSLLASDVGLVDALPPTTLICPSACAGERAKPVAAGAETWAATLGGGYVVFPDTQSELFRTSLADKLGSWLGLPGWGLLELQSTGTRTAQVHPRTAWPTAGVLIQTSSGNVILKPTAIPGEVSWTSAEASAATRLFRGGYSSLLLSKSNAWLTYPGRAVGAARVRRDGVCPDSFRVQSVDGTIGFAGQSCTGMVEFEELGRRPDVSWNSFLTTPHGATAYSFGPTSVLPLPATWRSAPWNPTTMDCAPDVPLEVPDASCTAAMPSISEGFPKPDCAIPIFRRSRDLPTALDRNAFLCLPGSPTDVLPPLPSSCTDFDGFAPAAPNAAPSVQDIQSAAVVRVGPYTRVYYSDREGRVVRVRNYDVAQRLFGASTEYNFDATGRLIGELEPLGSRRCIQYDREDNPIRVAHLPAPGMPAAQASIEERTLYGSFARPRTDYDPAFGPPTPIRTYGWDSRSNLTSISVPDPVRGTLTTQIYRRPDGRVDHTISPGGLVAVVSYDPTTKKPVAAAHFAQTSANAWNSGSPLRTLNLSMDSWWQPLSLTDSLGPTVTWTWPMLGLLRASSTQLDPSLASVSETYSYDDEGRVRLVDGPETDVEIQWTKQGLPAFRMESSTTPSVQRRTCRNYVAGRISAGVDAEGRWTRLDYDANGELVGVRAGIDSFGSSTAMSGCFQNKADSAVSGMERLYTLERSMTSGLVNRRVIAPDSVGPQASGASRDSQSEGYIYDGYGRLTGTTQASGVTQRQGYDSRGRVVWAAVFSPVGGTSNPSPAALADTPPTVSLSGATLIVDPSLDSYVTYTYDPQSRVTQESKLWFYRTPTAVVVEGSGWLRTTWVYDDIARSARITDPTGRTTTQTFDEMGRPAVKTLADGTSQQRSIYLNGGLTERRETTAGAVPGGLLVEVTTRLRNGAPTSATDALSRLIVGRTYDPYGRVTDLVEPSLATRYVYDAFGQVTRIARMKSGTAVDLQSMTYTRNGQMKTLTDGNLSVTQWKYDRANRVSQTIFPNGVATTADYFSGTGLVATATDRSGVTITSSYDAYGLPKARWGRRVDTEQRDTRSEWARSALGLVFSRSQTTILGKPLTEDVTRGYLLDSVGNVIRETSSLFPGNAVQYERDGYGRASRIQTASNDITRTFEAGLGRLDTIRLGGRTLADYNYAGGVGSPTSVIFGNGLRESRTYDARARLRTSNVLNGVSATVLGSELVYGDNEVLARADQWFGTSPRQSQIFRSDEYGRLQRTGKRAGMLAVATPPPMATLDSWLIGATGVEVHGFDAIDNISSKTLGTAAPIMPNYGTDQRVSAWSGTVGNDADGRVTAIPAGSALKYDGLGRVFLASGSPNLTFVYDADDRLAGWNLGQATAVTFEFADGQIVREHTATSDTLYVPGEELGPVVTRVGTTESTNHYTFGTRLIGATSASGVVVERYDYSAYGTPTIMNGAGTVLAATAMGNRLLLTGQPWLPSVGAYSQGARLYRPDWGRFLTADPIGFRGGTNRYLYGMASPHVFVDPLGLAGTPWPGLGSEHGVSADDSEQSDGDFVADGGLFTTGAGHSEAGDLSMNGYYQQATVASFGLGVGLALGPEATVGLAAALVGKSSSEPETAAWLMAPQLISGASVAGQVALANWRVVRAERVARTAAESGGGWEVFLPAAVARNARISLLNPGADKLLMKLVSFPRSTLRGVSLKWLNKNKPTGWTRSPTRDNDGWIWTDGNGIERLRFMRPNGLSPAASQWSRQSNGYFRWQDEAGNFLDIDGRIVPLNHPLFQELTHIMYEGPL